METSLTKPETPAGLLEKVVIGGDLKALTPQERLTFYRHTCESLGLNPLTKPFSYIILNGKLTLYANKDCTEQLRKRYEVSVTKMECDVTEGIYVVRSYMQDKTGRTDISIGAVPIDNVKGEARANAMMKCETKSKRRGTLSICGLGMLDETEVDSIPGAQKFSDDPQEKQRLGILEEINLALKAGGLDKEENKGKRFGHLQACFHTNKKNEIEAMDLNSLLDGLTLLKDRLGIKRGSTTTAPIAPNPDADTIPGTESTTEAF